MDLKLFFGELTLFLLKTLLLHSFLYLIGLNSQILSISLLVVGFIIFIQRLWRKKPR